VQRILLIADNSKGVAPLQQELLLAGYHAQTVAGRSDVLLDALNPKPPDILVLDDAGTERGLKELRQILHNQFPTNDTLVVVLTAQDQLASLDFKAGVDDFLIAPYRPEELVCRIKLLLWKNNKVDAEQLLKAGDLVIDLANYTVAIDGDPLEFTYKEYELLRFLASHRGRVFTREALLNQVWGYDYYGGTRTVDVHIRRIRAKLGPNYENMVETVRNVGYRFNDA
jgi:DNA-binding response OmpR family regulator